MSARTPSFLAVLGSVALLAASSLSVAFTVTACKKDDAKPNDTVADEAEALAEDGTDSVVAETDIEIVTSSLVSATATSGSLTLASTNELGLGGVGTAGFGDGASALYFPRGCLKAKIGRAHV